MKKLALTSILFVSFICITPHVNAQIISGGHWHSLFLCGDYTVMASGDNSNGQLADGTNEQQNSPIMSPFLTDIAAIYAGSYHSMFLKNDGTVLSSGLNNFGQLGDGTFISQLEPVTVENVSNIISITGGLNHTIFLKSDGTVWGCGFNHNGELGDETFEDKSAPIQLNPLSDIIAIAAGGAHSLFLKSDGTVLATGSNLYGQFGNGENTAQQNIIDDATALTDIIAIEAGGSHSLYLKSDGTVWATGQNENGQLGDGTIENKNIPVQVQNVDGIIALAAGLTHSLFLKNDGTVWACGGNWIGQLGDGTNIDQLTAIQIPGLTDVTEIDAGEFHSLFRKSDGTVWTCGRNLYGALGIGSVEDANVPMELTTLCSTIFTTTAIDEIIPNFTIAPNPASDFLNINLQVENFSAESLTIMNLLGEVFAVPVSIEYGNIKVNVSSLAKGNYIISVVGSKNVYSQKLVII